MRFDELKRSKTSFLAILARQADEGRYIVALGVILVVRRNSGN